MKSIQSGKTRDIVRVVACVAIAAIIGTLVPHVFATARYSSDDVPAADMPIVVRIADGKGGKRKAVRRWSELEQLRASNPELMLLLDTKRGRIAMDSDGGSLRHATYDIEEYPQGQIVTLVLHDTSEQFHSTYRVEGNTIYPIAFRVERDDYTTLALLAGLIAALALGRVSLPRRARTSPA
jgi:hypothetical protein